MTRQIIATDAAPHPDAPISQAVRIGPGRTAFEANLPHPDFLLEIECVAEA